MWVQVVTGKHVYKSRLWPGHSKLGVTNRPHATVENLDPTLCCILSHPIQSTGYSQDHDSSDKRMLDSGKKK